MSWASVWAGRSLRPPERHDLRRRGAVGLLDVTLSLNDETSGVELHQIHPYADEMLGFFEEITRDTHG
jgi:hypothetical protein